MSVKLLIIDDEANIRMMMRLALEHVGYTVDTASDGAEGLVKYGAGEKWDLVLLDQRMPGLTGLEVQREIRKRSPKAKMIMTTAFGTIDLATKAMEAGAADFLRKPFTAETLRAAVKAALERKPDADKPAHDGLLGGFARTTINGYRLELCTEIHDRHVGEVICSYKVHRPEGDWVSCKVILPAYVMELVKAYADVETMPFQHKFWPAMCEEALANYLWQNAEAPPDHVLKICELSSSLQKWVDGVLTVEAATENAAR